MSSYEIIESRARVGQLANSDNLPTEMGNKRLYKYVVPAGMSNVLIQHGNDYSTGVQYDKIVIDLYCRLKRARSQNTNTNYSWGREKCIGHQLD
jgi:hypothetical protein